MKKPIIYLLLLFAVFTSCDNSMGITKTTCEMQVDPLAVDTSNPRFGWRLESQRQGAMQSAYFIEVYAENNNERTLVWSTGKINSSRSQLVSYEGEPLKPLVKYLWRVKVWDDQDIPSAWSKESTFRIAPGADYLDASWIGAITHKDANIPSGRKFHGTEMKNSENKALWEAVDTLARKSICLRKEFSAGKEIKDAIAYVCGLGHYEFTINGNKVGDGEFAPLWSDYEKTVYYNTYDVTSLINKGENAVGILLGNGFYNVQGGRYRKLQISFGAPTLFLKLRMNYTDGTYEEVVSGSDWKYHLSPITFNCIYGGEDYDARLEQDGWDKPGFNDSAWHPVVVQEAPVGKLRPQLAPPVKIMEYYTQQSLHKLTPEEIEKATVSTKRTVAPSAFVLDMGQNLSGFPQITVNGKRGQKVTLLVAEALTDEGAANQRQTGRQHYYQYTLKGDGDETWHPRFSYYGFRYIQVEGAVPEGMDNPHNLPVLKDIRSCFIYNSADSVSTFETSNKIFNNAHRLINKAVRSNMQSVFTDCPHREKIGWLEQVHLNGPGLFYNYDLSAYIPKVMRDMADAQYENGMVPTSAPQYVIFEGEFMSVFADSPEWGSSIVVVPFIYYDYYGDDSLIKEYYQNIRAYVDYLTSRADNHIVSHGLGDWYDYGDFRAGFSRNTPVPLVATGHYYMDILYLIRAAKMVGNAYDEAYYSRLAEEVKAAFNAEFFDEDTRQYGTGSQSSNAIPLFLNMVDTTYCTDVLNNLVKDIQNHGNRLTTGDVGNRYLFQTLARNGLNELMYTMHNHEEVPGYGFQLKFGATTLTEQWDPRQGSSWNHFMMGQIDEWFFHSLAGIQHDPDNPGYQHLIIRPEPVGDLKYVKASYETLYGWISIDWTHENDIFAMKVTVPVNCTAEIYLPGEAEPKEVKSGKYEYTAEMKNALK